MQNSKKSPKPKTHWETLLKEVVQKKYSPEKPRHFPPIVYETNYERRYAKYQIEETAGLYFTQREGECVMQLLRGKTMNEIGETLQLSPRTIEYYLNKIKKKLNCKKKKEIIEIVSQTNFVKSFRQDPYNKDLE